MKKTLLSTLSALSLMAFLTSCDDAQIASENISTASNNFEISRRIVFFNGITDKYLMSVEGLCSIKADMADKQLEVTCKTGPKEYKKHFFGLSDNVSYFVEQTEAADVSVYHYRVVFKPQTILPDVDFKGDLNELTTNPN